MNEPNEVMPEMETSAAADRAAEAESNDKIAQILDIPLKVSVELGRARMLVQDLLDLHKGSVLELNKLAGEPLEVLVNDKIVARGEVVVVNEKFGIRLTDIVSHTERIRQLGENG
ncbi:MAG: flagellar motor switch protein FliN [Bdellovibrionales bacterium]|nr:flagellar motor switch protein FliN [Bdellovibrionales bacterium]